MPGGSGRVRLADTFLGAPILCLAAAPAVQLSVFAQRLNRTLCQSLKQFRVSNDAAFNGFVHSCAEFALGQSRKSGGIDENYRGLVKGAQQILPGFQIHSGFAAYGRIELYLNCCGYLN